MREQCLYVSSPSGEIRVIVTAAALESLRDGAVFQDGASLVRSYRSMVAEIAREKIADSAAGADGSVRIFARDLAS